VFAMICLLCCQGDLITRQTPEECLALPGRAATLNLYSARLNRDARRLNRDARRLNRDAQPVLNNELCNGTNA
jgi:hypothetical protein